MKGSAVTDSANLKGETMAKQPTLVKINVVRGTVIDGERVVPKTKQGKDGKAESIPVSKTVTESTARLLVGSGHAVCADNDADAK